MKRMVFAVCLAAGMAGLASAQHAVSLPPAQECCSPAGTSCQANLPTKTMCIRETEKVTKTRVSYTSREKTICLPYCKPRGAEGCGPGPCGKVRKVNVLVKRIAHEERDESKCKAAEVVTGAPVCPVPCQASPVPGCDPNAPRPSRLPGCPASCPAPAGCPSNVAQQPAPAASPYSAISYPTPAPAK